MEKNPIKSDLSNHQELRNLSQVEREKIFISLQSKCAPDYIAEVSDLSAFFEDKNKLPNKIDLSQAENENYNLNRLVFITRSLGFLLKFHANGNSPLLPNQALSILQKELQEGINLLNCREILLKITITINNFSRDFLKRYDKYFSTKALDWDVFEKLGGLMAVKESITEAFSYQAHANQNKEILLRPFHEYLSTEQIVEEALSDIINMDVLPLKTLIDFILDKEKHPNNNNIQAIVPINLPATLVLTRRLIDTQSLVKLLRVCSNLESELQTKAWKLHAAVQASDNLIEESLDFVNEIDLSGKLQKHAALRRIQNIGELLTGKNFSSQLTKLDPTTDWRAFITLRDVIAHQDLLGNVERVNKLLNNDLLLGNIILKDIRKLYQRLTLLIYKRDEALPQFHKKNIAAFWQNLLKIKKQRYSIAQNKQRISLTESKAFIAALKNDTPVDVKLAWVKLFNGTDPVPDRKRLGDLQRWIPSKKENEEANKACKMIVKKLEDFDKTSAEERQDARLAKEQAAREREAQRLQQLKGLTITRQLALEFMQPNATTQPLTKLEHIKAAITALENIKEFLEQDDIIQAKFNFKNIDDWSKTIDKDWIANFYVRLASNPELTDAIEYNAGQLLQRFETIKSLPEVQANKFFSQAYPTMRSLRNYIEHGHHIIDNPNYNPDKKREDFIITERHKNIGPVMITLIIELLPELIKLRAQPITNTASPITIFFQHQQVVSSQQNNTNVSNPSSTVASLPANNNI